MFVALLSVEVFLPDAQSLKDKRMSVRRVKDRLKALGVAAAEVGHLDVWQRAALGVVAIGNRRRPRRRGPRERPRRLIEEHVDGYVTAVQTEHLESYMQGSRPARIGEQIRQELTDLLSREVRDPGHRLRHRHARQGQRRSAGRARLLHDARRRRPAPTTAKALDRATPFLRQQPRRAPPAPPRARARLPSDESIARQERIETLLQEIREAPKPPGDPTSPADRLDDILAEIRDAIRARSTFLLTSHARPDGDSIGSQVAIAAALRALGKDRCGWSTATRPPPPSSPCPGVADIEVAERVDGDFDAAGRARVQRRLAAGRRPASSGYFIINIDHHPGNAMYGAINWFDGGARPAARWCST